MFNSSCDAVSLDAKLLMEAKSSNDKPQLLTLQNNQPNLMDSKQLKLLDPNLEGYIECVISKARIFIGMFL